MRAAEIVMLPHLEVDARQRAMQELAGESSLVGYEQPVPSRPLSLAELKSRIWPKAV